MPPPLQPVRGTRDIIGEDSARHNHVVETARKITSLYGFSEWQTPIFEDTKVFSRTLGETSDVVTKEMYTFADRGGDSVTLRPEGTAGVCRALITNGLTQTLPQKVFYQGPMFRYERPQKGRYRQFHQIGVELLGSSEPLADAEVISCAWRFLQEIGVAKDVSLQINTLGDINSRNNYRLALVKYFQSHESDLSQDSKARLDKNPLRILDSKDDGDRELCADAPTIYDYLSEIADNHYSSLKKYLKSFGVPFEENSRIVRGLDYYNHTAFEFVTNALGAQGTVLAGGRYDGLVEQMGGPSVAGVGWAAGIDRLALLLNEYPKSPISVVIIPFDNVPESEALKLIRDLRGINIPTEYSFSKSSKRHLEKALKSKARIALILGPSTGAEDSIAIQDLNVIRQKHENLSRKDFFLEVRRDKLITHLASLLESFAADTSLKPFSERLPALLPEK